MGARIACMHPEGNFPNNPHLSGLVEILLERGHAVDLYCRPHVSQSQAPAHPGLRVIAPPVPPGSSDPPRSVLFGPGSDPAAVARTARAAMPRYDLVVGVDLGIIEAAWLARAQGVPHGLVSYELHFADESPPGFKDEEREACRDLAFALCQDAVRGELLRRENALGDTPLFTMPVAGRGPRGGERSFALHQALGLPRSVKLAVAMGSVDTAWTGTGELLRDAAQWPEDWALVLHHRFDQAGVARLRERLDAGAKGRVFVSPFPSLPGARLGRLLHACDLGLAFYTPTYDAPLLGKNLEYIGMASGKFCTYMQHGLPVVVNDSGEMGGHVRDRGLGWRVERIGETHRLLAGLDRAALDARRAACLDFFARRLDLDALAGPFLAAVEAACAAQGRGAPGGPRPASPQTGEDAQAAPPEPEASAAERMARARLALALGQTDQAAELLARAVREDDADLEAVHLLAVVLDRGGRADLAGPLYREVARHRRVADGLAAWALFKRGEIAERAGDGAKAARLYARAVSRDPHHAKALLALAPPDAPLRVRLGGWDRQGGETPETPETGVRQPTAPAGAVRVPMDPLDAGLWDYYFTRRAPDHVVLGLPAGAVAADAARLAELLALRLAPGGAALVRLPSPGVERRELLAVFAAGGLSAANVESRARDEMVVALLAGAPGRAT